MEVYPTLNRMKNTQKPMPKTTVSGRECQVKTIPKVNEECGRVFIEKLCGHKKADRVGWMSAFLYSNGEPTKKIYDFSG